MVKSGLIKTLFLAGLAAPLLAATPDNGTLREQATGLQVWSTVRGDWVTPEQFFADDLKALGGPTYGRTSDYPPYDQVREWETIVDLLPDGRECPMVFFHNRWRRLADVRALDERLRNYGGCRDVFRY